MRPCKPDASLPARGRSRNPERSNTKLEGGPCWLWRTPLRLSAPNPPPVDSAPCPPLPLGTFCSYATFPSLGWGLVGPISGEGTLDTIWEHVMPTGSLNVPIDYGNAVYCAKRPSVMGAHRTHAPGGPFPMSEPDLVGPISFRGTTGNKIFSLISTIDIVMFPCSLCCGLVLIGHQDSTSWGN